MQDPDLEISKWRQQRKKGLFHFIISSSLLPSLGVLIGNIVATLLFTDNSFNKSLDIKLLITVITLIILTPLFGIIHW